MAHVNVFIVGSKGIPAKYGGFETFVENLTAKKVNEDISYFVSCMGGEGSFEHNGALCFRIPLKKDRAFSRIFNVGKALSWIENYIKNHRDGSRNIVYILGCRVGLLIAKHRRKLNKLGALVLVNPDGLEWKRDKWNAIEKRVLLFSEKRLIRHSDFIVCDSKGIQQYVIDRYHLPESKTGFIAYGSDVAPSKASISSAEEWLTKFGAKPFEYYLIVGRFVPENNYELMIREFMASKTEKKLLIITNFETNAFYASLEEKLHFKDDPRIVFAGTLYDAELLKKIRELAYCYIHGHSVGGTNPSLLEALASTKINLLYDVVFNREVGGTECFYFSEKSGDMTEQLSYIEGNYDSLVSKLHPKKIVLERYSWDLIVNQYESLFLDVSWGVNR